MTQAAITLIRAGGTDHTILTRRLLFLSGAFHPGTRLGSPACSPWATELESRFIQFT